MTRLKVLTSLIALIWLKMWARIISSLTPGKIGISAPLRSSRSLSLIRVESRIFCFHEDCMSISITEFSGFGVFALVFMSEQEG